MSGRIVLGSNDFKASAVTLKKITLAAGEILQVYASDGVTVLFEIDANGNVGIKGTTYAL